MFHVDAITEEPKFSFANVVVVDVGGCDVHLVRLKEG